MKKMQIRYAKKPWWLAYFMAIGMILCYYIFISYRERNINIVDKHIFISYNHNDGDFAEILINRITSEGFKVWIDNDQLKAGEDWRVDIDQAIKNAFALIVIMTPQAKASEYVTYEWSFAWGAGVKVIPLMLEKTLLHPRLEALQDLDFTSRPSRPWNKLINALKNAEEKHTSTSDPESQNISAEQIMQAAQLLVEALAQPKNQKLFNHGLFEEPMTSVERTEEAAERINRLITPDASNRIAGASVLWIDDRPTNNTYERGALESLGIQFTLGKSTEEALKLLERKRYDVIISDMGHPPDNQAGYTLLEKIKEKQINSPFIIYAGSRSPENVAEARRRGAIGTTNNPAELFDMVIDSIKNYG